ncbi:MAG: phytoene desaturase family protein [Candidatus Heimdallarchaeaceae archaeon]
MTNQYDIIIVGSGLGGLVAGAKLAKEGKKVLLIEQHSVVGGCSSTFTRKGFTVDVGLHQIDGIDEYDEKMHYFEELGVYESIEFVKHGDEFYRFVNDRIDVIIPDKVEKAIKVLTEQFPEDEKAINDYFNTLLSMYKEIHSLPKSKFKFFLIMPLFPVLYPSIVKWSKKTVGEFVDSLEIKNKDLKLALLGNIQYYTDDPYKLSMLYYSAAQGSYLVKGAYYLKGGSQKLSNHFAKVITDNNGEIILSHMVDKIIVKGKRAVGVEYFPKRKPDERKQAFAKHIVANAAVPNVIEMLPKKQKKILEKIFKDMEIGYSHYSLYLGFSKPLKEIGNKCFATMIWPPDIKTPADIGKSLKWPFTKRRMSITDYSQLDSGMTIPGKSVAIISGTDILEDWEKLSKDDYKKRKEQVTEELIERLEKLIPRVKEYIEWKNFATPSTIKHFTLNPNGTSYGYAQLPSQSTSKRPGNKSPIKGLWFASAWVFPGGGFTPSMTSGYNCALKILKEMNK